MKESLLNNGVLDFYSTFETFDTTKISIDDIFNKYYPKSLKELGNSKLIISDSSANKMIGLNKSFSDYIDKRREEYLKPNWKEKNHHFKLEFEKMSPTYKSFDNFGNPFPWFFSDTEGSAIDLLNYSQHRGLELFVNSLNYEEQYSGLNTLDMKSSFMLFPIKIFFSPEKIGFIDITITIFKHGYCCISASLRINNYSISELSQDIRCLPIKDAFFPKFMLESGSENDEYEYKKVGRCNNLDETMNRYIKYIQKNIFRHDSYVEKFTSVSLLDTNNLPSIFSNEILEKNNDFIKDSFSLLFAPIPEDRIITKIDYKKLNSKAYIPTSETIFYANEHRMIFSIAKKKNTLKAFNKKNDIEYTENQMLEVLYESYRISVPFLLEKILLKKYSSSKHFSELLDSKELIELKRIKELRIFELGFEDIPIFYNYGSTRTLFNFLFDNCIDPNSTKIIDNLIKRNEDLIDLSKRIQTDRLSYGSAVFAIVFTALFSIEGIEDVLKLFGNENPSTIKSTYFFLLFFVILIIMYIFKDKLKDGVLVVKNKVLTTKTKQKISRLKNGILKLFIT